MVNIREIFCPHLTGRKFLNATGNCDLGVRVGATEGEGQESGKVAPATRLNRHIYVLKAS